MSTIDTSGIDATKPEAGNATTSSVRDNFSAIKTQLNNAKTDIDTNTASITSGLNRANHIGSQLLSTISDAGTMASQNASSVAITGGSATGLTDLDFASAGAKQDALDTMTQVAGATDEHVLTKDTVTGNAIFKALSIGQSEIDTAELNPIVQTVRGSLTTVATGTTAIPFDDTIPQNTEGDQYLTQAITPTSATNLLRVRVIIHMEHTAAGNRIACLFKDTTADALACGFTAENVAGYPKTVYFDYEMVAGTTSAITFKIRAGANIAGTLTVNGNGGTRLFGGVLATSITIDEILQ